MGTMQKVWVASAGVALGLFFAGIAVAGGGPAVLVMLVLFAGGIALVPCTGSSPAGRRRWLEHNHAHLERRVARAREKGSSLRTVAYEDAIEAAKAERANEPQRPT